MTYNKGMEIAFGRVEEAKGKWGRLEEWKRRTGITFGFVVFFGLSISMLGVGAAHANDCPVEKMVPIYLIGNRKLFPQTVICQREIILHYSCWGQQPDHDDTENDNPSLLRVQVRQDQLRVRGRRIQLQQQNRRRRRRRRREQQVRVLRPTHPQGRR